MSFLRAAVRPATNLAAGPPRTRGATPRPRSRLGVRSLTGRLTLGVVGLVVLIVLVVGGGTALALRSFLYQRLDQQVRGAAQRNAGFVQGCLNSGPPGALIYCYDGGIPSTLHEWVAVLDHSGHPYRIGKGNALLSPLLLSHTAARDVASDPLTLRTINEGPHELRAQARETQQGLFVVTGLSTAEVHRTLGRLAALEIAIGGATVLLAAAATASGVRFTLRGLRRVSTTAQEVAAELSPTGRGLERRVSDVGDNTEVGQLAQSMNTLLAAVETQFRARLDSEARLRQFLADASHELRTPLTSIRGYAELARMKKRAAPAAALSDEDDTLDRIEAEGTRMSRLVEDLLTLARNDRPDSSADAPPARELVDVADVVDEAVAGARAAHPDRPIEATVEPGLQVLGDPDQLVRVLRNLITNAAVHTAAGRPITVAARTESADAVLRVIDQGPGLTPEDASHVFERFWRADKARSRARGGSGLGLSIVAAIVADHGGNVRFDSDVQRGTTVTVRLPGVAD